MKAIILIICIASFLWSCTPPDPRIISREDSLPADTVKIPPAEDEYPPILHSPDFEEPTPFEPTITRGAEDSPFIPADRKELYFFFTPDVRIPPEKQLLDGATGIYRTQYGPDGWETPKRILLQKPNKLALDGCPFAEKGTLLFCSAREGYTGLHWFSADEQDFKNYKLVEFPESYDVGELHINGDELYYHSSRTGGKGGNDIWMSKQQDGKWQEPINLEGVNTAENEGYPYLTPDGQELWFTRQYQGTPAIYRSYRNQDGWDEPELIVSQFAGEPTLDWEGNLYFVHHYYKDAQMLEADIYIAKKR